MQKELNREIPCRMSRMRCHVTLEAFSERRFCGWTAWTRCWDRVLLGVPMKPPENLRKLRGEDDPAWAQAFWLREAPACTRMCGDESCCLREP